MPSKMTKNLTRHDIALNFAEGIERERVRRGFTQAQMAEKLDLNVQAYKRIISGEVEKVEIYTAYKAYLLTTRLAYDFVGYNDMLVDCYTKMKDLNDDEIKIIDSMVNYMIESKKASGDSSEAFLV